MASKLGAKWIFAAVVFAWAASYGFASAQVYKCPEPYEPPDCTRLKPPSPQDINTLPIYDLDGQVAKCVNGAQKAGEEYAKKEHAGPDLERLRAENIRMACEIFGKQGELQTRDELAKHWDSFDSSIRLRCIGAMQVANYSSLQKCIEALR